MNENRIVGMTKTGRYLSKGEGERREEKRRERKRKVDRGRAR